jgi:hypothetical protein
VFLNLLHSCVIIIIIISTFESLLSNLPKILDQLEISAVQRFIMNGCVITRLVPSEHIQLSNWRKAVDDPINTLNSYLVLYA